MKLLRSVIVMSHVIAVLIALSGDVHPNPGPVSDLYNISISHSNIRSLKGRDKMASIAA